MEKLTAQVLLELKKAQDDLKESQRTAAIEREVGKYHQKGAKRSIGFCLKLQHNFEDEEEVLKVEEGEEFATADNLKEVNLAIKRIREIAAERKELVQKESNAQIVGATSPHGWKTVEMMEGSSKVSVCSTLDVAEVRKAEKELMGYERDLRNSRANAKREREFDNSRRGGYIKRGRGGSVSSGSGSGRACFKCGSTKHVIDDCPEMNKDKED